jgi:hypothetical protein
MFFDGGFLNIKTKKCSGCDKEKEYIEFHNQHLAMGGKRQRDVRY